MLVLTRKVGERIIIGEDISITILDCRGGQVRIGIDAPPNVAVHREEIHNKLKEQGAGMQCDPSFNERHDIEKRPKTKKVLILRKNRPKLH